MNAYRLPPLRLLNDAETQSKCAKADIEKLQIIINDFKIPATVEGITVGPRTSQYELRLHVGTSINRVKKLLADIALCFGVESVTLVAIPEKKMIGLEIPHDNSQMVTFKSIINTSLFKNSKPKTTIGIGKVITGETVVTDIADMPHLLVAGATGSGKSVFINTLIASLLYKATPDEVKFVMIDPKMVELSGYNNIPHLLAPVIVAQGDECKKVVSVLQWVIDEMLQRYEQMASIGTKKLDEYNNAASVKLPRFIIIIDELADLMLSSYKCKIEHHINRIAALGRAAGIHLVVATQRPDATIVTGLIKANIPSRIAFKTSNAINSRIILDEKGAEKLLGKGDMLYHVSNGSKALRIQGAFITNTEIDRLISYIKVEDMQYHPKLIEILHGASGFMDSALDDLMMECKKASEWQPPRKVWIDGDGKECSVSEVFSRTKGFQENRNLFVEKWV